MDIFQANQVSKQFANHLALNKVSIQVPQGEIFGLLGPNGAGKTTLIRIINQITAPDSGELLFNGRPLKANDVLNIGYLPEERGLYKKMKVGEQAIYLAQLKGLSRSEAIKKLKSWFDKFDILPWWDKKVEELSKGMQQKIQFIVTILHQPELLIFDEPFSGFDPINTNLLKQEILNLKNNGSTIIFSTHNMASVEEVCDHIALINKSQKIIDGPVEQIKQQYKLNQFECTYQGAFEDVKNLVDSKFKLLEHKENHTTHYLKAELSNDYSNNAFLALLMQQVKIISFNEVIPSMDDIFIRVVENDIK
jgi:ABC-2 type transport system ATP-binding protein